MDLGSDINESKQVGDCPICLEPLGNKNDDRTLVTLRCSHIYHLDCIGSAFNEKNKMQCPTCRQLEKGEWLYAQRNPPVDLDVDIDIDALMPTSEQVALGLVQPSMNIYAPESRDTMLPYSQNYLDRIFPNSARSIQDHPVPEFNIDDLLPEMPRMEMELPAPEWRDAMLPSFQTQLDRTLPNSAAPYQMNIPVDNGVRMYTVWGSVSDFEMMLQRHLQVMMYGYDRGSRGTSNGGGSSSGGNSNGEAYECLCGFCNR